jgi:predicted ATPase/DNA-binding SARP family transcriptional activator
MEYRVLGPLEVRDGNESLPLAGAKQRALLALLLVHANHVLSRDRLIDELWGEHPPDTAVQSVQVYVSRLRKLLPPDTLLTRPPGYLLEVEPDELDLWRFERLLAEGREAHAQGDPERASALLHDALVLWRGPALAEFAFEPFAQAEIGRLEDLRLVAVEERIEADLALGQHAELIGELEAVIAENPHRERLRGQLMVALYRSGRQGEALAAYQHARSALVDELGVEPSGQLRQLEKQILNQDPRLAARPQPAASPRKLPTGTVTLVFADVEGSTRLLHLLGERFAPARARMREIVRQPAAAYGGVEVDWAGDGAFLAFPRARDALAAVAEMQRALAAEPWPPEEALRLRFGIHTGEPALGDEGYVGMDVVIAARICGAAHGDQVVVSRATRDMAGEAPVPDGSYRPLGRHRLKDVPATVHLFQLLAPGLRDEFPPLRTLSATSLPALHHRLVGRADALARIESLLGEPNVRLVTITGPGGAGKSRLALEIAAAAALDRPVHLVGLAPVTDPAFVPNAIARAIGVRESGERPLLDSIADSLNGTGALLYLDNFEHLAPAAVHVAQLLDGAPDLDVLATSRAPLRLSTERVHPLAPLSIADATTLFVELAAARGVILQEDALASVREICRRLDGLPLAIELVAARLAVLPPAEILRALGEGLALDMEGPIDLPERQRTLRAAIEWSYQRLTASQRELHGSLAVFSDGAALDDARAVAVAGREFLSDLEALVGWSLVRSEATEGDVRLSMLETVREHALDGLLADGMLEEVRRRHAERFLDLAVAAETELSGPDQVGWSNRLEREYDNLTAALDWLLSSRRSVDALRAISALERFWRAHGHIGDARRLLALGLDLAKDAPASVRADALWTAARLASAQSDWGAAVPLLEEALASFRAQKRMREVVFALSELGFIALRRDDSVRAAALCDEALALARDLGDPRATSGVLAILTEVARTQGDHHRALALSEEALELRRSLGDPLVVIDSTYHVGVAAFGGGDLDRAQEAFEAALELARRRGDSLYTAAALCMLGTVGLLKDDLVLVEAQLTESLAIYAELEDDRSTAECLCALGGYAAAVGHPEAAAKVWGAGDHLRGDGPLEYAEPAIEARFGPDLVAVLGVDRYVSLRAEGGTLDREATLTEVRQLLPFGEPSRLVPTATKGEIGERPRAK